MTDFKLTFEARRTWDFTLEDAIARWPKEWEAWEGTDEDFIQIMVFNLGTGGLNPDWEDSEPPTLLLDVDGENYPLSKFDAYINRRD